MEKRLCDLTPQDLKRELKEFGFHTSSCWFRVIMSTIDPPSRVDTAKKGADYILAILGKLEDSIEQHFGNV